LCDLQFPGGELDRVVGPPISISDRVQPVGSLVVFERSVFRILSMIMWVAPVGAVGAIAAVVGATGAAALTARPC
jgi:Na+/H+-dicarboxylate symporter